MDNQENQIANDNEMVVIDYYDRINHRTVKLEVTRAVANFLKSDTQKTRRKQNKYDFHNKRFDKVFNESKPENEHFLVDEEQDLEWLLGMKERENLSSAEQEHNKVLIENAITHLSPQQREVVEMAFYENMSYREIAERLGISKQSVHERMKNAEKNIKNHIKNTEN